MPTFVFGFWHSDLHPYTMYTEDIEQASPVWVLNNTGLPHGALDSWMREARFSWACDPSAPKDRIYGRHIDAEGSQSEAIYYNADLRNGGAWVKKFDLAALIAATGDGTLTEMFLGGLATVQTRPGSVWATISGVHSKGQKLFVAHSHDYAETWTVVEVDIGDFRTAATAWNLVISQHNPDNMYFTAWVNNYANIYRSTDQGHSFIWTEIPVPFPIGYLIPASIFLPHAGNTDANSLYAFTSWGVFKSTNARTTCSWTMVNTETDLRAVSGLAGSIPPDNANRIVAYGSYYSAKKLYISSNGGVSFIPTDTDAPGIVRSAFAYREGVYYAGLGFVANFYGPAAHWVAEYSNGVWTDKDGNAESIFGPDKIYVRCSFIIAQPGSIQVEAATAHAFSEIPDILILNPERSEADVVVGEWTSELGLATGIYLSIDDLPTQLDLSDYAQSPETPGGDIYRTKIAAADDPELSELHSVYYCYQKSGAETANLKARLMQGVAVIVEWTHTNIPDVPIFQEQELTPEQADSITDYSDLYLEFEAY